MVRSIRYLLLLVLFFSCRHRQVEGGVPIAEQADTIHLQKSFFPVTTYLKGQLRDIQTGGVNPLKYITINNTTDSSWVKMEDIQKEATPFLEPIIDTANMVPYFSEKKFLDQTMNAYTFTYDPIGKLSNTLEIQHWDVYVDPVLNKVKRIYIIKKTADNKIIQLTWQSDKWFKIVTIANDQKHQDFVEKEVLIKWDF